MTKQRLTTFEYALLGLISISPMTGYDIHKVFATTPFAHFSSSPGSIYPALQRLSSRGLLKAVLDKSTEARPRRVFTLTSQGKEAFEAWLRQPVTRDELIHRSGAPILRFALAKDRLSRVEMLAYLETYRRVVAAYIAELSDYADQLDTPDTLHNLLALNHGIGRYRSELEWVSAAVTAIKRAGRGSRKQREPR